MDNINSMFISADELIDQYIKKNSKFLNRFVSMETDIQEFIKVSALEGKVTLNNLALGYLLIDYFEDITRLKKFHKLSHVNSIKIVAHMSYWLLRRKPIQVLAEDRETIYVNERFVLAYISDFISSQESILMRDNAGIKSFLESLLYYFKYRSIDANSIEMILLSFFAGQIYQEKDKDLSQSLSKKYE